MTLYTKAGDNGKTTFGGCEINKNDPIADVIGTIDELNSHLGLARYHITDNEIVQILLKIQNELFILGAQLYGSKNQSILVDHVQHLEFYIDKNEHLLPNQFILPGGSVGAAEIHVARAVCRRAERNLSAIQPDEVILQYINRLSDCLFVMALKENHVNHKNETPFIN